MEYVIGVILVVIVITIIVLLFRKRLYDQIDYYENWKVDIMGRKIAAKLTEVKALNSEGEAKENLIQWKQAWDHILMHDLASVEEVLFDAESSADRFRIDKAHKYVQQLEEMLVSIEKKIHRIEKDIDQLIETDESNREAIERVEPQVEALRKRLMNDRSLYDRAAIQIEEGLDDLLEDIRIYKSLVEAGSYSEASAVVKELDKKIADIENALDHFPHLYKKCKFELPNKLDDLYKNVREMELDGYYLEHLHIKRTINDLQARLLDYVVELENLDTEKIEPLVPETEAQIEEIYDQLEQEVLAKNYVESKAANFAQSLKKLIGQFGETKEEVQQLKKTYHFEDKELETYLSLEKRIDQLTEQHQHFLTKLEANQDAQSVLRDDLTAFINDLEAIKEEHDQFKVAISNLRKDELEAREQIDWMIEQLGEAKRKLRLSNLPGVPNFILTLLDEATEKSNQAIEAVEKQPLDIAQLQKSLVEAKNRVENAIEQTDQMIEQAQMTEMVIQYANRYRSRDPILAAKLLEAEELFRKADYELALEQATEAILEKDPAALERIEALRKEITA